jgi:hypothetical protein
LAAQTILLKAPAMLCKVETILITTTAIMSNCLSAFESFATSGVLGSLRKISTLQVQQNSIQWFGIRGCQ